MKVRNTFAALLGASLLGAMGSRGAAQPGGFAYPWYSFKREGQSVTGSDFEVEVSPPRNSIKTWTARRRRMTRNGEATDWIDGGACPTLTERMATLKALEPLTIRMPGDAGIGVVLDGELYTLKALVYFPREKSGGDMTLTGNVDTPLAKWVEDTMKALKSCWQDKAPE